MCSPKGIIDIHISQLCERGAECLNCLLARFHLEKQENKRRKRGDSLANLLSLTIYSLPFLLRMKAEVLQKKNWPCMQKIYRYILNMSWRTLFSNTASFIDLATLLTWRWVSTASLNLWTNTVSEKGHVPVPENVLVVSIPNGGFVSTYLPSSCWNSSATGARENLSFLCPSGLPKWLMATTDLAPFSKRYLMVGRAATILCVRERERESIVQS